MDVELTFFKKEREKETEAVFRKTENHINLELKFTNLSYCELGHLPFSCTDFGTVSFTITHRFLP